MNKCLSAKMLYYLFESANIHRWNDHIRPFDLTELDKQAHKAVITWVLGKFEELAGNHVDWRTVIEHTLFSFLQRLALTDLKPQIFHEIVSEKSDEVNEFVLKEFGRRVPRCNEVLLQRFKEYLDSKVYLGKEGCSIEDRIVDAAHFLATKWEFDTIEPNNQGHYGIEKTHENIYSKIDQFRDLVGLAHMNNGDDVWHFVDLIAQLRFQLRWARAPRIPNTTVLGHSLMVADAVLLNDLDKGVPDDQLYFDYYSALFHDVPEALTRDVITPVKQGVEDLDTMLSSIERRKVDEVILPLIPAEWHEEVKFFVLEPFKNVSGPAPRDGDSIKACDMLSAWMEAFISDRYGVTNRNIRDGIVNIGSNLIRKYEGCIGASYIMDDFKKMDI
ncbi:MAG: HD domain-containing protein [archaeon]|nr:HD domain-containing protein [archaeon]